MWCIANGKLTDSDRLLFTIRLIPCAKQHMDMPRERGDSGQYRTTVTPEDVLAVFDAVRGPVVTSADVADAVDVTRETARRKLNSLVEDGRLAKRTTAGRVVYWRADESDAEDARAGEDRRAEEPVGDTATDAGADVVDAVAEGWDDTGERLDARKAAARAVLEYAREHGTVSKQEAKEDVRPEYPVEGQNARTWYRKNIRPVLNEVAEYDQSARAYRLVEDATGQGEGGSSNA